MVTNDDGIDSIGLHVLARAMRPFGEVVIAAPDQEYSGFGAAVGTLFTMRPEVRVATVDGIDEALPALDLINWHRRPWPRPTRARRAPTTSSAGKRSRVPFGAAWRRRRRRRVMGVLGDGVARRR